MVNRGNRWTLLDPRIRAQLRNASPDRLRRIATAAAAVAVEHADGAPQVLTKAVAELQAGRIDPATAQAIADLADDLDHQYLVLHDDEKPGGLTLGWESAFRVARAAAAVTCAFDLDPMVAARESVYEALAALDDDPLVLDAVIATP